MIVSVPKNTLTAQQKSAITKKGLIVIECDEPEKIRVLNVETSVDTNDFFMAALYALTKNNPFSNQEHFINNLYKRLKEKELFSSEQNVQECDTTKADQGTEAGKQKT